jgi:hypothetical protein
MNKDTEFVKEVAVIFEENCLHSDIKKEAFENALLFCINYCLDKKVV